jgi:hypothetical protein
MYKSGDSAGALERQRLMREGDSSSSKGSVSPTGGGNKAGSGGRHNGMHRWPVTKAGPPLLSHALSFVSDWCVCFHLLSFAFVCCLLLLTDVHDPKGRNPEE